MTGLLSVTLLFVAPSEHGPSLDGGADKGAVTKKAAVRWLSYSALSSYYTRIILSLENKAIIKFVKMYL